MTTNFNHIMNDNLDMFEEEITEEELMEVLKEDVAMTKEYTVDTLVKIFEASNWKEVEITCPDGTEIAISPCAMGDIHSVEDVECFLVYGDIPWMGGMDGSRIQKLVDEINNHAQMVEDLESERKELRAYFEGGEADGWTQHDWSWYSDWHKDLYGYRPHGHVCGQYVRPW